jgi:hypothetical protein
VICLNTDNLDDLKIFELGPDLLLANAMECIPTRGKTKTKWKPLFWPDTFVKQHHSLKVSDNALSKATMNKMAIKATKMRKVQRDRASQVTNDFGDDNAEAYIRSCEALSRRMHKGFFPAKKSVNICKEFKKKRYMRGHLTLDEKINMIYDALVKLEPIEYVAAKYH